MTDFVSLPVLLELLEPLPVLLFTEAPTLPAWALPITSPVLPPLSSRGCPTPFNRRQVLQLHPLLRARRARARCPNLAQTCRRLPIRKRLISATCYGWGVSLRTCGPSRASNSIRGSYTVLLSIPAAYSWYVLTQSARARHFLIIRLPLDESPTVGNPRCATGLPPHTPDWRSARCLCGGR
jgi:hypothetical protein